MAGLRQYNSLADVPFNLFNRNLNSTLDDFVNNTAIGGVQPRPPVSSGSDVIIVQGDANDFVNRPTTGGATTIIPNSDNRAVSINGNVYLDNDRATAAATPANGDYTVYVYRDLRFEFTTSDASIITRGTLGSAGNTDILTRGTHAIFVNCDFIFRTAPGQTGPERWKFREGITIAAQGGNIAIDDANNGGWSPARRPNDISAITNDDEKLARSRSFNFYGCSFNFNYTRTTTLQTRLILGEMDECIFYNANIGNNSTNYRMWPFLTPGTEVRNTLFGTVPDITHLQGPNRINFSGATAVEATDTRGFGQQILDGGQVKSFGLSALPATQLLAFNQGNGAATARSYFKAVNPVNTIGNGGAAMLQSPPVPPTGGVSAVAWNSNNNAGGATFRAALRYIELQQFSPRTFEEGTTPAAGIAYRATYPFTFTDVDTYNTGFAVGQTDIHSYTADTDGFLAGTGFYIPDTGEAAGTITQTGVGAGLQIPVDIYRGPATGQGGSNNGAQAAVIGNTSIAVRSFWHDLTSIGGDDATYAAADGEATYTVNKANLVTRANSSDNAGTALAGGTTPVDVTLSTAAQAVGRTIGDLNTYFTGLPATMQNISDALKWIHYNDALLDTPLNIPFRTITTGNTANWTGNVTFGSAGSLPAYVGTTLNLQGGALASATTGTTITDLNITGNVAFGGVAPNGARVTASGSVTGLPADGATTSYTGGLLAGEYDGTTGDALVFADGTDLTGFTANPTTFTNGNPLIVSGNFVGLDAVANQNIQVAATYQITGLRDGQYLGIYDVTGTAPNLTIAARGALSGILDEATNPNFAAGTYTIPALQASDRLRIVVTSLDDNDFVANPTVVADGNLNTVAYIGVSQSVPVEIVGVGTQVANGALTGPTGARPVPVVTVDAPDTSGAAPLLRIRWANADPRYRLSPTQTSSLVLRAVKTTADYNFAVALINAANTVQLIRSGGVISAMEAQSTNIEFDVAPGSNNFQAIGFVAPQNPSTGTLEAATIDQGNGVLVFPAAEFDLPLTVNSLEEVVSSQDYIDSVSNPTVFAVTNLLDLADQ